jgi:hypothetical protein
MQAHNSISTRNLEAALLQAAQRGVIKTLKAILHAGVFVDAQDCDGMTALHYAAWNGRVDALKVLLKAGAALEVRTNDGETALHWAAWDGSVDVLEALLEAGADVDATDNNCRTALHYSAWCGHVDVFKALLEAGVEVDRLDELGHNALELARIERTSCIDVLNSISARRTNVLARVVRFAVFEDSYDEAGMATAGLYFEDASEGLYESLFERVLTTTVESRLSLAECRLVSKAWRRGCDNTLFVRPVEFFAPASMAT